MDHLADSVAECLRHARERRGLTQATLARAIGWPRHRLVAVELGRARLSLTDAVRLCLVLDCDLESLFAGTPEGAALKRNRDIRLARNILRNLGVATGD